MPMPSAAFFQGHQRSHSQAQQLLPQPDDEPPEPKRSLPRRDIAAPSASSSSGANNSSIRFSTLGSDCSSSYYRLPGSAGPQLEQDISVGAQTRSLLRANLGVVIGSLTLALLGSALLLFGLCVMFFPNDMDVHGWLFLVVGVLFAIPGFYHIVYICCALCGRPGYSLDSLPTFSKRMMMARP